MIFRKMLKFKYRDALNDNNIFLEDMHAGMNLNMDLP